METSTNYRSEVKDNLVKGLDNKGLEVLNWVFAVLVGAGGVLSSTYDMAKFAQLQLDTTKLELLLTRKPTF